MKLLRKSQKIGGTEVKPGALARQTAQQESLPPAHQIVERIQRDRNGYCGDDLHARIAELAYALYEQRGRQDGYDLEDWIQAERQILSQEA